MTKTFTLALGMVVAVSLLGGCQTAGRAKPVKALSVSAATNTVAGPPPLDPRAFERRAEADARFLAGVSHELNNEPEQAVEEFFKAALADPGNEPLVLDLTTRFVFLKRYDQAAEVLAKALQQPGASAAIDTRLAFVNLQRGRTNDALCANEAAIQKNPRFIGGYRGLFILYSQTGQTNEATKVLDQAAAAKTPDADFLVDLSEMYFLQDRAARGSNTVAKARARDALNRAAALNPTNFFVLQKLADGFTQTGDRKQAQATLVKLQQLYPDMPNVRERLLDLYLRDRDKKGAAEQLEGLIRENPTNPQAYYLLGILAFEEKRFKEAADSFHKTLLLNPDFEPAYYELAVCEMNLDRPKEALATLAKGREKFKETFLSEYLSALALMRQKDYTNAVQRLTTAEVIAVATDTNRLTHIFYFQIGSACERAGRWHESEKHLLKCLKLSPDFDEALNYLGYMYAERGTNLVQAREMIEKALQHEPDNAAYLDSLGWVRFKQGQMREALRLIERAIKLNKEPDATLYDHQGDILVELKEPEKAREAYKAALGVEANPEVQKKLERLPPPKR
ncbi:MAG: tetratricopeptide repeat protein [Verrucomicrobia bacterium]|nr:tetratricopeptide repeat protein [Verrucomicrobiota bacterium]